ncbi:ribonuclease H-like domain-containing protein [Tanacetum coccineum]|uniref:Ribonuclease H-like domain-containing protein n=1 Tax=Tanacetum coccineum TaxID=301880 RepID=A0ABQ5D5E5_9ASTR
MDQDSAHMVAASKVPMLKPGEYKIWWMRIKQYIQMIDYALWEVIENGATLPKTKIMEGVMTKMPITTAEEKAQRRLEVKARSTLMTCIPNEHQLKFNSIKDAKKLMEAVEKRFGGNAATRKTQRNLLKKQYENFTTPSSEMLDQTFDRLQKLVSQLELERKRYINGNEIIGFDKSKVECYNCHKKGHFARECRAPRNQDNKNKESSRRSVHVETSTSTALVSCDGLGGYYWSDQAEEGPNYALMAYSSLSSYSKFNGFRKDNGLKWDIQVGEITIRELKKKLEKIQKEKDIIQFNVDKFENASKSLDKLIEYQIVNNCKKGLGHEKYNAVPPPYTVNFMPPTPDLSFTGLDEFVNEPIVKNSKAMSSKEEPKVVRRNDDAPIIEEYVSDSEEEMCLKLKLRRKQLSLVLLR